VAECDIANVFEFVMRAVNCFLFALEVWARHTRQITTFSESENELCLPCRESPFGIRSGAVMLEEGN